MKQPPTRPKEKPFHHQLLHFCGISVWVFLRHSCGYKFFTFSLWLFFYTVLALGILSFVCLACNTFLAKLLFPLWIFLLISFGTLWVRFFIAYSQFMQQKSRALFDLGFSHLLKLPQIRNHPFITNEGRVRLFVEPALISALGLLLVWIPFFHLLGAWFILCGLAMFIYEWASLHTYIFVRTPVTPAD